MLTLGEIIQRYRGYRFVPNSALNVQLHLSCRASPPADDASIESAWGSMAPAEVVALWRVTSEAWLFEDTAYGQYGLHLLSPEGSRSRTMDLLSPEYYAADDFVESDLVIGEFIADSRFLVVPGDESRERLLLVSDPILPRAQWWSTTSTLAGFLDFYFEREGAPFW